MSGSAVEDNTMEQEIDRLLEVYVKYFVKTFEAELTKRKAQQAVGSEPEVGQVGKTVKEVTGAVGGGLAAVLPVPGASAAGKAAASRVTDFLFEKTIGQQSREKAKTLHELFRHVGGDDLRRMVVQAAGEVFRCFEYQFIKVIDIGRGGSRARALEKLAEDAVDRIMNYIKEHNKEECTVDLLIKGVILGESKKRFKFLEMFKTGRVVSFGGQRIKTTVLYDISRIVVPDGDCFKYYTKASRCKEDATLGYRLLFSWEQLENYNQDQKNPEQAYAHILNHKNLMQQLVRILRELDRKDKEKTSENVYDIREKLSDIHNHVVTGVYERKQDCSFNFDVRKPISSFTGRNKELEELHEALRHKGQTVISQIATVSGLGGIGKTELARKYISVYGKEYDDRVVWINAENHDSLSDSFQRLYHKILRMRNIDIDTQEIGIKDIVDSVYQELADKKCLFVFDNAEKRKDKHMKDAGIDDFLPSSPMYAKHTYVLITSRNRQWGKIGVLGLDVLNAEEAKEFIKHELNIQQYLDDTHVVELAESLQYLPLALQQAVTCIRIQNRIRKNLGKVYNIKDYLREFRKNTKTLLDHGLSEDSDDIYTKTVYTTWGITFSKIENDVEYGKRAKYILEMISFLSPDNIHVQMFMEQESTDHERLILGGAIELLKQYSMIQEGEDSSSFNVHRLVQQVTRLTLKDNKRYNEVVDKCWDYFMNSLSKLKDFNNVENSLMFRLFYHLNTFISHLGNGPEIDGYGTPDSYKIKRNRLIEKILSIREDQYESNPSAFVRLLYMLSFVLSNQRAHIQSKEVIERALSIQEKYHGPDTPEVALTIHSLALYVEELNDHTKMKELLERALDICEKYCRLYSPQMVWNLFNLGRAVAYSDGYGLAAKNIIERLLSIQEKHFEPCSNEIAMAWHTFALAVGELGDQAENKELLDRSLSIGDKHSVRVGMLAFILIFTVGDIGDYTKNKKLLERTLNIQEADQGPDSPEITVTLKQLALAAGCLGDHDRKKILLERTLNIEQKNHGPDSLEVADVLHDLAIAVGVLGDRVKKEELLERSFNIRKKHLGSESLSTVKSMQLLIISALELGDQAKMKELFERALNIEEKLNGTHILEIAETLHNLAIALGCIGDHAKQILQDTEHEQSINIQEKLEPDSFYVSAKIFDFVAIAIGGFGNLTKHKELLELSLAMKEKHHGPDNLDVARELTNLAIAMGELGDHTKKKELTKRALNIAEQLFQVSEVANTLHSLAITTRKLSGHAKEKELLEQALNIEENLYGPDSNDVATTLYNLALAIGKLGDHAKKKDKLERVVSIVEKYFWSDSREESTALFNLAIATGKLGDHVRMKELLERSLNIAENHFGLDSPEVALTMYYLAVAVGMLGDHTRRKGLLDRCLNIAEKCYGLDSPAVAAILDNLASTERILEANARIKELLETDA